MGNGMEWESKNGLMDPSISDSGRMVKLMDMGKCSMQTVMSTKEIGWKIRRMDRANIIDLMAQYTKEDGAKTSNMAKALNPGLMELITRVTSKME
jgi:hypothetical protein